MGQVESFKHARENRCSLRIFTGRGLGLGHDQDLSPGALHRLVDESVRLARVTRRDEPVRPARTGGAGPGGARSPPVGRRRPCMRVEEKIEWARRAEEAALDTDPRVTNSEGAEFYDRQARVFYASTAGFAGTFRVLVVRALGGARCLPGWSTWSATTGTAPAVIWPTSSPRKVGREAARRACAARRPAGRPPRCRSSSTRRRRRA